MPLLVLISELPTSFPPHRPAAGLQKELKLKQVISQEDGQATAEYALVVVAAAAVAGTLIFWATNTGALAALFDAVVERVSRFV